jgi:hypothetical protein
MGPLTARMAWTTSALVALATIVAGPAPAAPAGRPSPRVVRFLGERAADVLAGATRVEVFRVSAKRAGEGATAVGGYEVVASFKEQGEQFGARLGALLLDEKTYRFGNARVGGFTPVCGIRAWKGERSAEVLLSFATDEVVVLCRNPDDGSVRSAQEQLTPDARATLLGWLKEATGQNFETPSGPPRRGKRSAARMRMPIEVLRVTHPNPVSALKHATGVIEQFDCLNRPRPSS